MAKKKNEAAAALGRLGGRALAKKLTAEQRKESARKAAQARWAINFLAHCNSCKKQVTAMVILRREELVAALAKNGDVRVMHTSDEGDHDWSLNDQEKTRLRKRIAEGLC